MPKRLLVCALLLTLALLAGCQPTARIENNVMPTLISVTPQQSGDGTLLLQGRYFGDGTGGQAADSHILVGADISGQGGLRATVNEWGPSRIVATVPDGAGYGYVFVVVRGVRSNGLPSSLR